MREYKILFCFSNNIETVITSLKNYSQLKDYTFLIEQITEHSNLILNEKLNTYDCVVLQEFFNIDEPITIDYLCNFCAFKNLNIICIFEELKRQEYAWQLYKKGLYNCFFGDDAGKLSIDKFVNILINGRNILETKDYYNIKENDIVKSNYDSNTCKKVEELVNLYHDDEELLLDEFNIMTSQFKDYEIRMLVTELPPKIVEKLLYIPKFYIQYLNVKEKLIDCGKQKNILNIEKKAIEEMRLITVNSKNIGVVNLSNGAGATFFTMNFAKAISEFMKVSVVEFPLLKPYMYLYLGLNALCNEGFVDFSSYAHMINDNESIHGSCYIHNKNSNIFWIISDATKYQIKEWDSTKMMRLLYMPKSSSLNIVDIGDKLFDNSIMDMLEQFYLILVIIDPMVPDVLKSYELLEKIKELEQNKKVQIKYIINKFNAGVDKKSLLNYLDVTPITYIPYINSKNIYKAVYEGEIPCDISDVKNELYPAFSKLIKIVVPTEIYEQKMYKSKSLINKFKNIKGENK